MVLAGDLAKARWTQPVREWTRRVLLEASRLEKIAQARPRARFFTRRPIFSSGNAGRRGAARDLRARAEGKAEGTKVMLAFTKFGWILTKN